MSFTQPPGDPAESVPIPNRRTDTQNDFDAKTDVYLNWLSAFRNWLASFRSWAVTFMQEVTGAIQGIEGNKNAAQNAAAAAALSAESAAVIAGATRWAAGNYTQGAAVWSPISLLTYRRIPAGTTASAVDPANDQAGWRLSGSQYSLPQQELATAGPHQLAVGVHYIILHASAECLMPGNAAPQDLLRITNKSGAVTPILRRNGTTFDGIADDMQLNSTRADKVFTMSASRGWI